MTNSRPSSSDQTPVWEELHPEIQRWIWDQGWPSLRPVQELAIPHVHPAESDVLITAGTAGGKTEAAWLPIASRIAFDQDSGTASAGVKALYIGPLKALINDQASRLQTIFERLNLPVRRRHADVHGAERDAATRSPDGVMLMTPEALEAMFMLQGTSIPRVFAGLRYVVIDELHAFIGSERGAQLQSLLHRIELAIRRRVPRIALSATIADPAMATRFLRPEPGSTPVIITPPTGSGTALQLQIRGYVEADNDGVALQEIADHLYQHLRGNNNLAFANSRRNVELVTAYLATKSEEHHVPNEFFAHHGSVAKADREFLEARLKKGDHPTTAVCTSTLEMGIDIGSVTSVAQIGSPGNAASLRQRLGRSGRRGTPAVLRLYATEAASPTHPADQLRLELVESIAIIELLLEHWLEPPVTSSLHLSTLVQQVLSMIAQHSGVRADEAYSALCGDGPFSLVDQRIFADLLRGLGAADIIQQSTDGVLLGTPRGEKLMNHYSFYTAFETSEEYRLMANHRQLGTLPVSTSLAEGSLLVFGGRSWRITRIDGNAKVIELAPDAGGDPPRWGGHAIGVHDGVRQRMRDVLRSTREIPFLNAGSRNLLHQGRSAYLDLGLDSQSIVPHKQHCCVFPWVGDRALATMALTLRQHGVRASVLQGCLELECDIAEAEEAIRAIVEGDTPEALTLADLVADKLVEKHDALLSAPLQCAAIAARDLDVSAAMTAFTAIASQ